MLPLQKHHRELQQGHPMKETGMLFTSPMVRAILEGRNKQENQK